MADDEKVSPVEQLTRTLAMTIAVNLQQKRMGLGFCLFLFEFDGQGMTYVSNASRESMKGVFEEFLKRLDDGSDDELNLKGRISNEQT